jgi:hypothetical protein
MENNLDKLFRDKLEQHSIAPSAHAWEKVAARFPKKNNAWTLSWRIAAAVALLGVVGWFAIDFGKDDAVEITKDTTSPAIEQPKQEAAIKIKEDSKEKQHVEEMKRPESLQQVAAQKANSKPVVKPLPVVEDVKENWIEEIQQDQTVASVEEVTEPVDIQLPSVKPAQAKSVVIVYNLAPVESKQDVEPAKTNRLKKVLEFAKDVKGGDATTFASVRNWKDNLLGSEEQTRVEKQNNE